MTWSRATVGLLVGLALVQFAQSNKPPQLILDSNYFIREDAPIGTVAIPLRAVDEDSPYVTFLINGEIANQILELVQTGLFSANATLKTELDRELVESYSILFEVSDGKNNIQRYTRLILNDVNDNAPTFTRLPYRADIPEDALPGTFVHEVSAVDPDTGVWGLVTYNISTPTDLFSIGQVTGNVTLRGTLDYETEKFYQLEIMAKGVMSSDGGGLNSTTDLIISVLDVQDTPPFFNNEPYLAQVHENATVGSSILKVTAQDGDTGIPNAVNYTFTTGYHDYFQLNASTGLITVAKLMNREDPRVLAEFGALQIGIKTQEVTDNPKGETTAQTTATIRILDVNDQVPTFEHGFYNGTVQENTQSKIPVTLTREIIVRDMDEGPNGRFELMVEQNGQPFDVFEVVPDEALNEATVLLRVKNSSALDYETVHSYSFQVVAREESTPEQFEGRTNVTIHLQDVNDNWPMFSQSEYNASIDENSPKGTFVTKITATDKDSGEYGKVTYQIRGPSSYLFVVDPDTGDVTVNVDADQDHSLLDREKVDTHYLTYEALDGGGLRTAVELRVILKDVNDNAPSIARSQYEGYVSENSNTLDRPVIVEATDGDLYPNNVIQFTITDGDPLKNFTINQTSGEVLLVSPLDYEAMALSANGIFQLTVTAADLGTPPLNSTVPVTINVQDVNDETPYFLQQMYEAVIPENSTGGTNVTLVQAKDNDRTAPNNEMIYRIESGAKDKFRIDANTGLITVESGSDLDRDVYGKDYTLYVLAIDRGTPPLTGTATVKVNITDVNNKLPVFNPDERSVMVSEGEPVGHMFFTYTATDLDENALLQYDLLDDLVEGFHENGTQFQDTSYLQGLFGIVKENGTLYVKSPLDRETVERVTVTVFVEDVNAEQPPQQNATAKLQITLDDVNDNQPIFVPSNVYTSRISEAASPGAEVTRVSAVDPDKNQGVVTYEVLYDTEESRSFKVESTTGLILLDREVDHEQHKWINITVMAMDSGQPPLNSTAKVHIEIEDVNDNSPEWVLFNQTSHVWENATIGTYVSRVSATDKDSGEYGRVMYFLVNEAEVQFKFTINNVTGVITVSGALDREIRAEYDLTIEARDNNIPPSLPQLKTPNYMKIKLLDVNDQTPQFTEPYYTFDNIKENANVGSAIGRVLATDADEGENAAIVYSINKQKTNASSLFDIRPNDGDIFVNQTLTGHIGWYYTTVIATDKGHPPLSNSTTVYLFIEDVNDHKPEIIYPPDNYTAEIMENVPIGTYVIQVIAKDKDAGRNGEVRYEFVENEANRQQDWTKFSINPLNGTIRTAKHIDREVQELYYLEVRAYDGGTVQFEDRRTLKVIAGDEDDNPPTFDRTKYPPPYHVSVKEEHSDIYVANLSLAHDPDLGNNSIICYYLTGGDKPYKDQFHINKTTGGLWLGASLDREQVPSVQLLLQASGDCHSDYWLREENRDQAWNASNPTMLLVEVKVEDINDNPPRFLRKWFTAGVTKDTQFAEPVLNLKDYAFDADEGNNSIMYFYIQPPFIISDPLREQLEQRGEKDPFTLGVLDGIIRTNIYFQQDMQGYIAFNVYVNDSAAHHFDTSNVSIYLLNEDQRVKVKIRNSPEFVDTFKDHFSEYLSNITGAIINVDMIRTHQDSLGKPDEQFTDMFIHAIDKNTGKVLEAKVLIDLIDRNYQQLNTLFKQYSVTEITLAVEEPRESSMESDLRLALILVAGILGIILLILITTFVTCRRKYKRKLKAATAMAFGSKDHDLNHVQVPGTNLHTYEGSNPMWMEKYEPAFVPADDTTSQNSLDNNDVDPNVKLYDEQERSMHLQNDQPDHLNSAELAKIKNSDAYLQAALQDHDRSMHPQHNNLNMDQVALTGKNSQDLKLPNYLYDNRAFAPDDPRNIHEFEATEI